MPSTKPLPTLQDFRDAFRAGIVGEGNLGRDLRTGSMYDVVGGTSALVWSREMGFVRDVFQAASFDGSTREDADEQVFQRYGTLRTLETYGKGIAVFTRSSTAATTIFAGTRIRVANSTQTSREYVVASNVDVATDTTTALVPIRSRIPGTGSLCRAVASETSLYLLDAQELAWTVAELTCGEGTDFEPDDPYKARAKAERASTRPGYEARMVTALTAVGLSQAVFFASTYGIDASDFVSDNGINAVYVGDESFQATDDQVRAAIVALESVRVAGCDLFVGKFNRTALAPEISIRLWRDPSDLNGDAITRAAKSAVAEYFRARDNQFIFRRSLVAGSIFEVSEAIQSVEIVSPSTDGTVLEGDPAHFPTTLAIFSVEENDVAITLLGPE